MATKLDVKKLRALKGNTLTPAALKAEGVSRVPIRPDGSIHEELLVAFIQQGEPADRYFERHLLVTPDELERDWLRRSPVQTFDPVSGEPETPEVAAAWARCAPVLVLGGAAVSAADLCAFAATRGLLPDGATSLVARMALPKGTTPVDAVHVEILDAAALAWPYDREAAQIANRRRTEGNTRGVRTTTMNVASVNSQTVVNHGAVGVQINRGYTSTPPGRFSGAQLGELAQLLTALFTADELRRALRYLPGADGLTDALPSAPAALPLVVDAAVEQLNQRGLISAPLFDRLLRERPGRGLAIQRVRELFGC